MRLAPLPTPWIRRCHPCSKKNFLLLCPAISSCLDLGPVPVTAVRPRRTLAAPTQDHSSPWLLQNLLLCGWFPDLEYPSRWSQSTLDLLLSGRSAPTTRRWFPRTLNSAPERVFSLAPGLWIRPCPHIPEVPMSLAHMISRACPEIP